MLIRDTPLFRLMDRRLVGPTRPVGRLPPLHLRNSRLFAPGIEILYGQLLESDRLKALLPADRAQATPGLFVRCVAPFSIVLTLLFPCSLRLAGMREL